MADSTVAICALCYIDCRFLATITAVATAMFALANIERSSVKGLDSAFQL
ncbi:hypothetical protein L2755_07330 [Shewanella abyssi]|nr:hypothetical protein [Shewanella abyssi]MCL1049434.1 hypothetical protein [Shewanella abyssi]